MPKRKTIMSDSTQTVKKIRPAVTPEGREQQMISLAMDVVEQRFLNGTASAQETVHFLKLASQRNQLEMEKLRRETDLIKAKQENLESNARMEKLYFDAMNAMKSYAGSSDNDDNDEF